MTLVAKRRRGEIEQAVTDQELQLRVERQDLAQLRHRLRRIDARDQTPTPCSRFR